MQHFKRTMQVRWSDMDANRHLRHSAYYDYGAAMRMMILSEGGLDLRKLEEFEVGPILFREEAIFKREIRLDDIITLDAVMVKSTVDFARWSLRHHVSKQDGTLAAIINIDGAWMDLVKRKLTVPNPFIQNIFSKFPKSEEYELIIRKEK